MGYRVAVVGATGAVGREMMKTLSERAFPIDDVAALASERSVGSKVSFGEDDEVKVQNLAAFDFKGTDIVFSSPGAKISAEFSPRAAKKGAVVIDNTSHFRMDPDVPLVVPEVNAEALAGYAKRNIVANPNCSTIQMVVALKPLHEKARIKRAVVATYQSTSGSGKDAMDELFNQTRGIYVNEPVKPEQFTKQIAFNVIPHIDSFMDDGFTKEEWKMMVETKKILDPAIKLTATCVRVPVFIGHAEAINLEFENPISEEEAREVLNAQDGVTVVDHRANEGYVTPAECAGEDQVYVSRIRSDPTVDNGLSLWVVSDNLRKGAALNAVQIGETLARDYL
ncbi:aspartate-semialdehyde dehydrogenase [Pelagibius sp.]|uniref:aspartate-semialdehyde dehydrogenase n=1 Tax=Pelagibius sp. TaxID=1931238 RepID=UPI00262EC3AE|nr:aspartate-semialdehyde dehydrogenase [Pelagibius sp.]